MATEEWITYKALSESQARTKDELMEHIERGEKQVDKLDQKVNSIDERVGQLNNLVLPLTVSMRQTAENTKEISESLKEFTRNQSTTNSTLSDRINQHTVDIEGIKSVTNTIGDKKKYNATVIVALIGFMGVFVTGLFQLAPILFE